jgi:glycosyltransferase involved in cell wall biosynthesis
MRVYQLARQMATRHQVTLLSYVAERERAGLASLREEMRVEAVYRDRTSVRAKRVGQALSLASRRPFSCRAVYSREMQGAIRELCSREPFDVIQLGSSLFCAFAFPDGPRIVLDEHNIEYEVFERMCASERSAWRRTFNRVEHARFRRFEQTWWSHVNGCVVTSDREVPLVQAHAPSTPVAAVPNGVDLEYFRPVGDEVEPRTLVFNGILTYRPNLDAAYHLVDEIWPLVLSRVPDARLTIVGRAEHSDLRRLGRHGVDATGEVLDIRPYLRRAAVVVVPIRMGGGTRLKVLEGLAMGKAMVSTSIGCEGISVRDREHLLIADGAQAFASSIIELFESPNFGLALGAAGRSLIETDYSWQLAGERLDLLYERVAGRARAHARRAWASHSTEPHDF